MSAAPIHLSETRVIPASPHTLYALISDITSIPRFSPETVTTSYLDGATAPSVGVRFKGVNAVGSMRWATTPTVTVAEPGRRFAFRVPSGARSTWTYDLTDGDGGTAVTESVHTERATPALIRVLMRLAGIRDRAAHLQAGMATTLGRLEKAAVGVRA